jgi:Tol biopolymer transport system component
MDIASRRSVRAIATLALVAALAACSTASPASPSASSPSGSTAVATASADGPSASASTGASAAHPLVGEEAWIAYQTIKGGGEGVWLIHPDGTDDHEVATDAPAEHLHPDWSPDGTQLLFTSRGDKDDLYVWDVAAEKSTPLWDCADPCVGDDEAVWSPDGLRIAFVRAMEPFQDDVPSCALMLGDPASGHVKPITKTVSCLDRPTFPHWSKDGTRIAYYRGVYEGDTTLSTALYVWDARTANETKLTEDTLFAGDSDWSAGDEWLIFSTYPLNDFQCCQVSNLYRIHHDGSGLEQLTEETSDSRRFTQPRYTPEGERLVVTGVTDSARELWVLPADASGDPIVVSRGGIYTHGTWQPGA